MFEFSIEMKKLGLTEQTQNAQNKSQIKKPAENGPKKTNSITPAQASAIAKNKPEVRKNIAQRPAASQNGVKTGRVKKNFMKNKQNNRGPGGNTQEFRNVAQNGANNKGNSGGGGQNWSQNRGGQKKQKQNMNVLMNY